jgi:hypothetical protein
MKSDGLDWVQLVCSFVQLILVSLSGTSERCEP